MVYHLMVPMVFQLISINLSNTFKYININTKFKEIILKKNNKLTNKFFYKYNQINFIYIK